MLNKKYLTISGTINLLRVLKGFVSTLCNYFGKTSLSSPFISVYDMSSWVFKNIFISIY
jgi:hypothetical protein